MHNTKLITILQKLTNAEWSSFRKYLLSKTRKESDNFEFFAFLQKRKDRLHLLEDSNDIRLNHFPKFSQKAFLNLLSRLNLWLEEWMAIEMMEKKRFDTDLYKIEFLNGKGLYNLADQQFRTLEKKLASENHLDEEKLEAKWRMLHLQYYSDNPFKKSTDEDHFKALISQFQDWIKLNLSIYKLEAINRSAIRRFDYSELINSLDNTISDLPESKFDASIRPLVTLVENLDGKAADRLFQELRTGSFREPSQVHTLATMYLLAYSLKMWEESILKNSDFLVDVYSYALEYKVLMQSGQIPVVRFHNIVSTIGGLQEYEKTSRFIDQWYDKVAAQHPESTRSLARAQNAFYHEKYDRILNELKGIEFENIIQKTRALGLEIIALYKDEELKHELLHSQVRNFQRFLNRNKKKLSRHYRVCHLNLSRILLKLYEREKNPSKGIDLQKHLPVIYRTWLAKEI